ncbi:hypothetical protein L13192_07031 [Pyrenophora tritici-repentis]|nr:hypothetical protein L13192_07031 [Pyrenophora tritici-repentis]KAI1683516.1 hypothetical protein KJE20_06021 [Pyrenophora tritici-repentis]
MPSMNHQTRRRQTKATNYSAYEVQDNPNDKTWQPNGEATYTDDNYDDEADDPNDKDPTLEPPLQCHYPSKFRSSTVNADDDQIPGVQTKKAGRPSTNVHKRRPHVEEEEDDEVVNFWYGFTVTKGQPQRR